MLEKSKRTAQKPPSDTSRLPKLMSQPWGKPDQESPLRPISTPKAYPPIFAEPSRSATSHDAPNGDVLPEPLNRFIILA
jgi:hypothetical protein